MPSRPIATRKTPAIFMITMSRCTRGRFLIVWISCLYVIRGALRAFSTVGDVTGCVIPRPPPESPTPRSTPRRTPRPLLPPVPVSAAGPWGRASRSVAKAPRASLESVGSAQVSRRGAAALVSGVRLGGGQGSGPAGGGGLGRAGPPFPPTPDFGPTGVAG